MSDLPKIVYFGSDAICLPGLEYLRLHCRERCELHAVVSQPDRPQGRGRKLQANPVAAWAKANDIELLQPDKPGRELAEWMAAEQVRLALVMAYGHFLPKAVREAPMHGMLNFHGSLLPQYRGASPVETALAEGEAETGVCLMAVAKEMDAGAVADCERVAITAEDTGPSLRAKIGDAVVPLIQRQLDAMLCGQLDWTEQDAGAATFCRKIGKEDGGLDFSLPARRLHCRMRAFTPWPGAYFDHEDHRIKVGRAEWDNAATSAVPGTVLKAGDSLTVATGEGRLRLLELQRAGGRMLPTSDFLRGYPIAEGQILKGGKVTPLLRKQP
ncbi:methionyl-tRNA formyltransferase [Coraliomargarita parva]|uniref:methionyl-tRNA formyltransferase n=1 Tax=Coraliomargarita parva TaxID=3014050 RepID=UPI0022B47263|nr:methionyl-tRNA formyltransferase [Coraliomargarita parva]